MFTLLRPSGEMTYPLPSVGGGGAVCGISYYYSSNYLPGRSPPLLSLSPLDPLPGPCGPSGQHKPGDKPIGIHHLVLLY